MLVPQLGPFTFCCPTCHRRYGERREPDRTGFDGLAIMPTALVAAGFARWWPRATGNMNCHYLHIPYLRHAGELVIVCTAIVGAGLDSCGLTPIRRRFYGRCRIAGVGRRVGHYRRAAASGVPAGIAAASCGGNSVGHPAGGFLLNYARQRISVAGAHPSPL